MITMPTTSIHDHHARLIREFISINRSDGALTFPNGVVTRPLSLVLSDGDNGMHVSRQLQSQNLAEARRAIMSHGEVGTYRIVQFMAASEALAFLGVPPEEEAELEDIDHIFAEEFGISGFYREVTLGNIQDWNDCSRIQVLLLPPTA
jgi:hypothetical protein